MKQIILIFMLMLTAIAFGCGKDKKEEAVANVVQKTPLGTRVESRGNISPESLNVIDDSLTKLFADARALGYTLNLNHTDYTIYVVPQCVDRNGVKVWLGRADNYDGTEYDQNPAPGIGEVYRSEEVLKRWGEVLSAYIICLDTPENMTNTTRYGAEHIILNFNDAGKFYETETHITGGHPLIPSAQQ